VRLPCLDPQIGRKVGEVRVVTFYEVRGRGARPDSLAAGRGRRGGRDEPGPTADVRRADVLYIPGLYYPHTPQPQLRKRHENPMNCAFWVDEDTVIGSHYQLQQVAAVFGRRYGVSCEGGIALDTWDRSESRL